MLVARAAVSRIEFFMEAAVPKVIFPDKDGALLKCLTEGQIDLIKPDGTLARERGIEFETCPNQGHEIGRAHV